MKRKLENKSTIQVKSFLPTLFLKINRPAYYNSRCPSSSLHNNICWIADGIYHRATNMSTGKKEEDVIPLPFFRIHCRQDFNKCCYSSVEKHILSSCWCLSLFSALALCFIWKYATNRMLHHTLISEKRRLSRWCFYSCILTFLNLRCG